MAPHRPEVRSPVVAEDVDEIAVYDGRHCLGYVLEKAAEWLALNSDHQVLGRYPGRGAATVAAAKTPAQG